MSAADTLDLAAAWSRMPADMQRKVGMAAIAVGCGHLVELLDPDADIDTLCALEMTIGFFESGSQEAMTVLAGAVEVSLLNRQLNRLKPPSLAALGIRQCTGCGCTDNCACEDGCSWAGRTLCSRCVPHG